MIWILNSTESQIPRECICRYLLYQAYLVCDDVNSQCHFLPNTLLEVFRKMWLLKRKHVIYLNMFQFYNALFGVYFLNPRNAFVKYSRTMSIQLSCWQWKLSTSKTDILGFVPPTYACYHLFPVFSTLVNCNFIFFNCLGQKPWNLLWHLFFSRILHISNASANFISSTFVVEPESISCHQLPQLWSKSPQESFYLGCFMNLSPDVSCLYSSLFTVCSFHNYHSSHI